MAAVLADSPTEARERLSDWSPEREMLAAIFDRLGHLTSALIAVNGGKPPKVSAFPRPETAVQRHREMQRQKTHERLVSLLTP